MSLRKDMSKEQILEFICNECYSEFKLNYEQDEDDYAIQDVKFCPFCGNELVRELDMEDGQLDDDLDLDEWEDDE